MRQEEAKKILTGRVSVTRAKVVVAKAKILEIAKAQSDSNRVVTELLRQVETTMPPQVVLHHTVDPIPSLHQAADTIAWRIAASEAIWELIHAGHLIPTSSDLAHADDHLAWTTVIPGSGGQSGGWNFPEYVLPYPKSISVPPSRREQPSQFLTDPDLFHHELSVPGLHTAVEQALREAIRCLRLDLFTASVAMLGKASEGAWLDLGATLVSAVPAADQPKIAKQRRELENPAVSISKKIDAVIALYERQDLYDPLSKISAIPLQHLREAAVWSDTVRDSRNTIHFGVQPSTPNTYDKVATLLMGAVPHLRTIYKLKAAAAGVDQGT